MRCGAAAGALLGLFAAGLSAPWTRQPVPGRGGRRDPIPADSLAAALSLSARVPDLLARPALVARLQATPHNYFRFVNQPFSAAVCALFGADELPEARLHGDAHVEQYSVTSLGWGLGDFDDSTRGPYVIDLVRFGVSLVLAADESGRSGADVPVEQLLRGYRDALADPHADRPMPRVVRRIRAMFALDHGLLLRRADALMDANPVAVSALASGFQRYATAIAARRPGLAAGVFRIKRAGRLGIGIGSALDEKYLLRIEGATAADDDDQILEAKLVRPVAASSCVRADGGPGRVLLGETAFASAPSPFSGLLSLGRRFLWVHSWPDDYVELSVQPGFLGPDDLRQVAYDVGLQLGRAHPRLDPRRDPPRDVRARLSGSELENEDRIRDAIRELARAILAAWRGFGGPNGANRSGTPALGHGDLSTRGQVIDADEASTPREKARVLPPSISGAPRSDRARPGGGR